MPISSCQVTHVRVYYYDRASKHGYSEVFDKLPPSLPSHSKYGSYISMPWHCIIRATTPFWGIVLACIPEFSLLMQCHRHKHTSRLSLLTRFPSKELHVNDIDRRSWSSKFRPTTWIPLLQWADGGGEKADGDLCAFTEREGAGERRDQTERASRQKLHMGELDVRDDRLPNNRPSRLELTNRWWALTQRS